MKTILTMAEGYSRPLCQIVEVSQEGVLCESGGKESEYNSTLDTYNVSEESYW